MVRSAVSPKRRPPVVEVDWRMLAGTVSPYESSSLYNTPRESQKGTILWGRLDVAGGSSRRGSHTSRCVLES